MFYYAFFDRYEIFIAQSDEIALDLLRNNAIEVFISDQKMPNISGLDFLDKAKDEFPDLVCIILTAYANQAFES